MGDDEEEDHICGQCVECDMSDEKQLRCSLNDLDIFYEDPACDAYQYALEKAVTMRGPPRHWVDMTDG